MGKFVGSTGLAYLWEKIKALVVGKADKIAEVNHGTSDTTFTLTPNVMHIWGKVTSLTLSLPTDSDSYLDEYLITFTAGANFQMYLPNTVKWVQELETEENKVYQVSIQYNLAGWLTNGMPTGGGGGGSAGDVNIIESISVNGTPQTVTNKNVDIDVPTDLADLSDDATHRLVTDTEKSAWNAKGTYSKPSGGIPKTDLASAVQTSLGKADTAMQAFIYDIDASNLDENGEKIIQSSTPYTAIHAAYQAGKTIYVRLTNNIDYPFILNMVSTNGFTEGGYEFTAMLQNGSATYTAHVDIGSSEYYIEFQQKFFLEDEIDPTVPSWAKASSKPSYTASEVGAVPTTRKVNGKALSADITLSASDVGALPSSTVIPDAQIQSDWNQTTTTAKDYIKNKPTIPSAVTESTVSGWGFTKNTGTYSKPSGGIPATDLASAVQTSLGKADTALQSFTESDPIFTASAAAGITSSDITNWNSKTSNTGTITGVSVNGTSVATSGVANITSVPASILSGAIPSAVTATTQSSGDKSTKIATTAYVDNAIENLPEPMIFKGSLGTGGTITSLPTAAAANTGFTYKVITAGTYASQAAKVGDTFISDGSKWNLIPSGDEPSGTVTSIAISATSPIAIDSTAAITTSGTRTISHATSGVTAGTYKSVTVNATGHVTGGTNPTTLSGYGITDAKIANGVITLGSNTITPITSHQDISGKANKSDFYEVLATSDSAMLALGGNFEYTVLTAHQDISGKADKTATVSTVAYDTTNHKITKTINGTTTDVVSATTIVNDSGLGLPSVTASDNGSIMMVTNGAWTKHDLGVQVYYTGTSEPANTMGNNGDIYIQQSE